MRKISASGFSGIARACLSAFLAVAVGASLSAPAAWADRQELTALEVPAEGVVWDGSADVSWYDASGKVFVISTAEQLAGLAAIANGTASGITRDDFTGKTVMLASDVSLNAQPAATQATDGSQRNWVPIGAVTQTGMGHDSGHADYDNSGRFNGTFIGGGHTISNIYKYTPEDEFGGYSGLFGALGPQAVVTRVALDGGYVYGRIAGGIAAASNVTGAELSGGGPLIENCYSDVEVVGNGSSTRGVGGIFGGMGKGSLFQGVARIVNCQNDGGVYGASDTPPVGGIAGIGGVRVSNCLNTGNCSGGTNCGRIVGAIMQLDGQNAEAAAAGYVGSVEKCNSTGSGKLYNVWKYAGDDESVTNSGDVFFLWDYPWTKQPTAGMHSLGDAFTAVNVGAADPEYRMKLRWMAGVDDPAADFEIAGGLDRAYTSSGASIACKPVVRDGEGKTLVEGSDYVVAYRDSTGATVAPVAAKGAPSRTYEAVVVGMGEHVGQVSGSFAVEYVEPPEPQPESAADPASGSKASTAATPTPATTTPATTTTPSKAASATSAKASIAKAKVTARAQAYTGKALKPAPTVKLAGKTLRRGADYTVTYKRNRAVGTATVTVTGKGSYTGTATGTFAINPKAPRATKAAGSARAVKLTWKASAGAGGYQVAVAADKKFASGKRTATAAGAKAASKKVAKLKAGKTYYAKVRAFKKVGKKTYYSAWSNVKSARTLSK